MRTKLLGILGFIMIGAMAAQAAEGPRVLFLSKSAGYEHGVVKVENEVPCHVENIIRPLVEGMGGVLTSTKDGGTVNAENLKNFDVVMFYTTEDLCNSDTGDKTPAMGPNGMMELINWVKGGGGLVGFHCASDTWHRARNQFSPESPYLDMLGGEFRGHGAQFPGVLRVVDQDHPTMAHIKDGWKIHDEWYLFTEFQNESMHVLALLDPAEERAKQEKYVVPNYPVIWCSAPGAGRVFYNAMGHRDDVWTNEDFKRAFVDAIQWASGKGKTDAKPNFAGTVPAELDPVTGAAREK
ncbi:MAG: ThuA domain-containing protein [Candidatus Hydrogenedentes bacterium]|nr:ThuA domain-containing protein [Candidatus Hydrogenedentota bacterium]